MSCLVFLLLRHFRKLRYDAAFSVVGLCLGGLAWKTYCWRGYRVCTSGVLVFSRYISFQCCNAINFSHWIESFSDTSPSASEKLCCLQFARELITGLMPWAFFWVAVNLSCLINILPFWRPRALLWSWLLWYLVSSHNSTWPSFGCS